MATARIIVVVGVTGNQGSAVAKTFLSTPGWEVIGLTRSAASSEAQQLAAFGVKLIEADLDDSSTLVEAFRGAHAVYANTDFFALTKSPNLADILSAKYPGKPLNRACMEHEVQQGKNIIDAASQALADGSPLECFIQSTLSHASRRSNGQVSHLLHFDSKGTIEQYLRQQTELAAKARYLQVGYYMSNVLGPMLQPKKAGDGVYEFYWVNVTPETVLTAVCPERDTGLFVRALTTAPPGTVLLGEGDPITVGQFLETWSSVTKQPHRLIPMGTEEFVGMVEPVMPSFGNEFADNFRYYRDFGYTGGDAEVRKPADLGISKGELTTYEQYLRELDTAALGVVA